MPNRTILEKAARFLRTIYLKLFRINDSPQRIAIGLGLGVFSGVLPGTGPIAALFLAFIFRVNRAAALLGSILTNTWLSIPVFLVAMKAGAMLTGLKYQVVQARWDIFIKDFRWDQLFKISVYDVLGPILLGYFVVALCIGALSYIAALAAVTYLKGRKTFQK